MKSEIPPKPDKPTPEECCGSGCNPCIYDYYYRELEKWEEKVKSLEAIEANGKWNC